MNDGIRTLTEQDIQTVSSTKQVQFGATGMTEDGRKFRYVSFGGTTTIVPGVLLQAAPISASYSALALPAAGTGGQTTASLLSGSGFLVVTNGSTTAVTQDQFAEGYLTVVQTSGSNNGPIGYRIKGNTAAATTANFTVYLAEPLRNASTLTAGTDTVNVVTSPYAAAQITTTVNAPIGLTVAQVVNTSSVTNYGWVQVGGRAVALQDASSVVIGNTIGPSTTTSGYVGLAVAATKPAIGWALTTSSTGGATIDCVLNIQS